MVLDAIVHGWWSMVVANDQLKQKTSRYVQEIWHRLSNTYERYQQIMGWPRCFWMVIGCWLDAAPVSTGGADKLISAGSPSSKGKLLRSEHGLPRRYQRGDPVRPGRLPQGLKGGRSSTTQTCETDPYAAHCDLSIFRSRHHGVLGVP